MVVLMLVELPLDRFMSKVSPLQQCAIVYLQGKQRVAMLRAGCAGLEVFQANLALRIEFDDAGPVVAGRRVDHFDRDVERTLQIGVGQIAHCATAAAFACACSAR